MWSHLTPTQLENLADFGIDPQGSARGPGRAEAVAAAEREGHEWVRFDEAQISEVAAFGVEREVAQGEILFSAGDDDPSFFLVLEGEVEIFGLSDGEQVAIAMHSAGHVLGELSLLLGQRPFISAVAASAGRVLVTDPVAFRHLMSTKPEISDVIFREFVARRGIVNAGPGSGAVRIIGTRYSSESMALRSFVNHSQVPHVWIDLDEVDDAATYLTSVGATAHDVPIVITATALLRGATPADLAEVLGVAHHVAPGEISDLVVVGSGPAGLAASIVGAAEGLGTWGYDRANVGGQAGASSRIENYVGFPNGVSGDDLIASAAIQASRLGAVLSAPNDVVGLRVENGYRVVVLADGSEIAARAVIIATGARYRRLDVENLPEFEGAGVYYSTTELEVRVCEEGDTIVIGGGNSAGQAALYLATRARNVTLVIRRGNLTDTMSHYLIERIEADPRIQVRFNTEVTALRGSGHLQGATLSDRKSGESQEVACAGVFCFIGAVAATAWLGDTLLLDDSGFILVDRSLPDSVTESPLFGGREPFPFETSVPGVFAAGDVRSGSLKRVASAVGEGTNAVRSVFDYMATIT